MFHKLLHSRPEPLSECLFQYASATSARSRRKPFQLLLPHTRTTRYRESFSIDQLFYGTHSRTTYNHSRIVNHFAMLSRTTTNHINLPQQKTFTYHSPLPFLNLQIVCTHLPDCVTSHATIFSQPLDGDPLDQGSSLLGNPIINSKKLNVVKNPEKSGLEPTAPNRLADRKHCALSTQRLSQIPFY